MSFLNSFLRWGWWWGMLVAEKATKDQMTRIKIIVQTEYIYQVPGHNQNYFSIHILNAKVAENLEKNTNPSFLTCK